MHITIEVEAIHVFLLHLSTAFQIFWGVVCRAVYLEPMLATSKALEPRSETNVVSSKTSNPDPKPMSTI